MNKTNDFKYNLPAYSDPVDIEDLNDNFRGIDDALMAGLCKKDYTGNNMGSSDPSARKYAWAPWFEIVNDNEFDVVVTDRNAPVESEEATINIAAGQTFRKYINGRYYMNFYVQDQHNVTFKWFTNAETYINESGGGGGGTGTVTSVSVQGGSGSHLTGSGNPIETSGTITINVDDGYSIPSDNEQTAWDGKAVDIALSIDSSTYVMTAQLKDSAGNLIGTAKTIDLPLETMVVDGEYDSQTKKIKLELKNGNYVEFSVADLVSGLQTELSASNKLDPDYIEYDASHRAVSDTEKSTWNGKQNAISDLATIRSGAAAGATAVQPSAMQDALDEKQDSLNSTQLAAVNSGIDSSKVGQISTNQTNILYAINTGAKNVAAIDNAVYKAGSTDRYLEIPCGNLSGWIHIHLDSITSDDTNASTCAYVLNYTNGQTSNLGQFDRGVVIDKDINIENLKIKSIYIYPSNNYSNSEGDTFTLTNFAIVSKAIWDQFPTFTPAALSNYDLTRLEAEDRAGLIDVVDGGAKNLAEIPTTQTIGSTTFTKDSNEWITSSSSTPDGRQWSDANKNVSYTVKAGSYIIYGETPNTNTGTVDAYVIVNGSLSEPLILTANSNGAVEVNLTSAGTIGLMYKPYSSNKVRYMICTLAEWKISQKFVSYCKFSKIVANLTKTITTSATLDFAGLTYNVPADVNRYLRVTAWAKASGKNPETIAIATTTGAILGYSAFPTDTTNSCISTSCIINTGSNAIIDLKVKYNGVGSNHTVGMIVEEL